MLFINIPRTNTVTHHTGASAGDHVALNMNDALPTTPTSQLQSAESSDSTYYMNEGLGPTKTPQQQDTAESVYDDVNSCSTSPSPTLAAPILSDN